MWRIAIGRYATVFGKFCSTLFLQHQRSLYDHRQWFSALCSARVYIACNWQIKNTNRSISVLFFQDLTWMVASLRTQQLLLIVRTIPRRSVRVPIIAKKWCAFRTHFRPISHRSKACPCCEQKKGLNSRSTIERPNSASAPFFPSSYRYICRTIIIRSIFHRSSICPCCGRQKGKMLFPPQNLTWTGAISWS